MSYEIAKKVSMKSGKGGEERSLYIENGKFASVLRFTLAPVDLPWRLRSAVFI
jgi:hypothetical protein